jgi:signal transduction histidine kinase
VGTLKASDLLVTLYELQKKPDSALKYFRMSAILKDSLFGREKVIAEQNLLYTKKEKEKELEASRIKFRNQSRLYLLSGGIIALLIIAFILLRANRQKQKSYAKLQQQKDEIDFHKKIAEDSLDELKTTQAHLIQSEKMASLGELTSGIAHEIQNPLNFVNNFSDLNSELIEEVKQEMDKGNFSETKNILDRLKENHDKINHHGKRAEAIVNGMLQHSRSSTGKREPTDLNKLVDEYLRLASHGMKARNKEFHANVESDFDAGFEKINIIPNEIGRVLLNLFNNAFYAVNEGAKLRSPGGGYEPRVTVQTRKVGNRVEIRVKDNGNGIPQNILDKIFQPFFTTKPTGQGTGLGLSIAYDIVKAHGGEIKVESNEGKGSVFTVQLPTTD